MSESAAEPLFEDAAVLARKVTGIAGIISLSFLIVRSFDRPAFENAGDVAPAACVLCGGLAECRFEPGGGIEAFGFGELVGDERGDVSDERLVECEDAGRGGGRRRLRDDATDLELPAAHCFHSAAVGGRVEEVQVA